MLKFLMVMVFLGFNTAYAALVEDYKGNQLKPVNLEAYLDLAEAPPEGAKQIFENKDAINKQLKNLYLINYRK